jgi:RNA polymerase sigma factor (sigma-70 family)
MTLEHIARRAVGGDRDAVDSLVRSLQDDVYGLALRMLWNREDAEDATQEILVRTVTRLSQFDFRSKLRTWVYRIAVNYIKPSSYLETRELIRQVEAARRTLEVQRTSQPRPASIDFARRLVQTFERIPSSPRD